MLKSGSFHRGKSHLGSLHPHIGISCLKIILYLTVKNCILHHLLQLTDGITWTDTGVYRPITLITHYSKECGYQGDVALTVTNADGYTRYYEPCDDELTNTND